MSKKTGGTMKRHFLYAFALTASAALAQAGCTSGEETGTGGGAGTTSSTGSGAQGGAGGVGGQGGAAAQGGTAGSAAQGGTAGSAAQGGAAGGVQGGNGGTAGAIQGGNGGTAGSQQGGSAGAGAGGAGAAAGSGGVAQGGNGGSGGGPACQDATQCDDSVACTLDECVGGACQHTPQNVACDDSVACTVDECVAGGCQHTPDNPFCDDGLYCTVEACAPLLGDPQTGCYTQPRPCDDQILCTDDGCDEANDVCGHAENDGLCDDTVFCTGVELCAPGAPGADALTGCVPGVAPPCGDAFACTQDFCDVGTDACAHNENDGLCTNGQFCDGAEACSPADPNADGAGCVGGVPPNCSDGIACTNDGCDDANDVCTHTAESSLCDDAAWCNGAETCQLGLGCVAGVAPNCNDGLGCTADGCDEANDACSHGEQDALCGDGLNCNGAETCDGLNGLAPTGCVAGSPFACLDDNIACTVESCAEGSPPSCLHTADHLLCPPGQFCIPLQGGCMSAQPCNDSSECDDNDDCNGVETCVAGGCVLGTPVTCDDGIGCTADLCDPNGGTCIFNPLDNFCDDGLICNGTETCAAGVGCVSTPPITCADAYSCTVDSCTEPSGICTHAANDAACDDTVFCNGAELCDPANGAPLTGCRAGSPPTCVDGIACTTDSCDPVSDTCRFVPNSGLCACGQTCDPQLGCGSYCNIAQCGGKVYQCGNCADDDGDCRIDDADSMCTSPCDNHEASFGLLIPGGNSAPCKADCYYDGDTGSGNDDCYWSHKCDPFEQQNPPPPAPPGTPPFSPEEGCDYDPGASIPGYPGTCAEAQATQSQTCHDICGPITPNGCDCFGCCVLPGASYAVWLGSVDGSTPSCTVADLGDPTKCKPCTQVQACANTCEHCEICVGKP
ncbi:MAG: hypothetical protein IT373_14485, partial [Polyangiaceae bacterium]|nr:hypothetical protein [Polyangiaceae bacterium]